MSGKDGRCPANRRPSPANPRKQRRKFGMPQSWGRIVNPCQKPSPKASVSGPEAETKNTQDQLIGLPVGRGKAIWLRGRVPMGYWRYLKHRRLYLRWLGHKLRFRKVEDWYRISTEDFKRNHGGSVLALCWGSSAIIAVKEGFPNHDWKEWMFRMTPLRFWRERRNHRRYMRWLGQTGYSSSFRLVQG